MKMNELEHCRTHFCGTYTLIGDASPLMAYFCDDPGHPGEEHAKIVHGLLALRVNINSNYEFELTSNNERKIRYHLYVPHNGYWFTDFACQSLATFNNFTLTIEMLPKVSTSRKTSYEFHQDSHGSIGITLVLYNGRTSCTVNYVKTD